MFRHKPGQLDSLKNIDMNELERQRIEGAKKLKQLEEAYWGKRENKRIGSMIHGKLQSQAAEGDGDLDCEESEEEARPSSGKAAKSASAELKQKKRKSVGFADDKHSRSPD